MFSETQLKKNNKTTKKGFSSFSSHVCFLEPKCKNIWFVKSQRESDRGTAMAHQHSTDFIEETYGAILVPEPERFNSRPGFLLLSRRLLLLARICSAHTLHRAHTPLWCKSLALAGVHARIPPTHLETPFPSLSSYAFRAITFVNCHHAVRIGASLWPVTTRRLGYAGSCLFLLAGGSCKMLNAIIMLERGMVYLNSFMIL